MRRPLRLTLAFLAWSTGFPPALAADGLTAYRGQDWAHLQAAGGQSVLWLGPDQAVELPATTASGTSVRYDDLVLLGGDPDGIQEWVLAGVAVDRNGPRLRLHGGRGAEIRALSPPERPRTAIQIASPRWLAATGAGGVQGLAWLEATRPRGQEVWLAPYQGGGFQPATRLVGTGPGSQTALDAAVLADGSWLLVWAAFDGSDDDLVWRQRRPDGSWTGGRVSPENRLPDITPRVLATADGAVLAWSRFDGSVYRVRTARFAQGEWRNESWAAGPDSLYPEWVGDGDTLLFLRGATRTWTASGPGLSLEFAVPSEAPPVLDVDPSSGLVRAHWPEAGGWRSAAGTPPGVRP